MVPQSADIHALSSVTHGALHEVPRVTAILWTQQPRGAPIHLPKPTVQAEKTPDRTLSPPF